MKNYKTSSLKSQVPSFKEVMKTVFTGLEEMNYQDMVKELNYKICTFCGHGEGDKRFYLDADFVEVCDNCRELQEDHDCSAGQDHGCEHKSHGEDMVF